MTVIYKVYDQVADLIAQLESEKILSIQISAEMQTRFNALVEKSKQRNAKKITLHSFKYICIKKK